MLDVRGRSAVTEKGVVQLGPGQRVRPGQTVTVSCVPGMTGQSAGSTRQDRALPRGRAAEPPMPPPPSFDTPQRPGFWGAVGSGGRSDQ